MNHYRIEFKGDYEVDFPLIVAKTDAVSWTEKDFRLIKSEAFRVAKEITDGYCRATVYRNGMRCFRYTVILDTWPNDTITQIWSSWSGGNYRTMRKVTLRRTNNA